MKTRRVTVLAVLALMGCAADRKAAQAPAKSPPAESAQADSAPPSSPPPPPPPVSADAFDHRDAEATLALSKNEIELAGTNCEMACRALGSMDRAAGHLCAISSGRAEDDTRRCADSKEAVYTARGRVKKTCGMCPDTSVERTDPVPFKR